MRLVMPFHSLWAVSLKGSMLSVELTTHLDSHLLNRRRLMGRRKFDSIRFVNRTLDRGLRSVGLWPGRRQRGRSFFDLFMDEITGAPRR